MKNASKIAVVLASVAVLIFMIRQWGKGPTDGDAVFRERAKEEPQTLSSVPPRPSHPESRKLKKRRVPSVPLDLPRLGREPSRQYDREYMRDFLSERRQMDNLETVSIGRSDYGISKSYKAILPGEGEGEGYYRVGSWVVVPSDYNEDEGYPVLFNKNNRTVGILMGLVSAKLKEDVSLERGMDLIAGEDGLVVDTLTRHLKILHVKYYPVTGQSLKNYEKKLMEMGVFSRLEFEVYGGGPYPN